jgi:hypothetical protein
MSVSSGTTHYDREPTETTKVTPLLSEEGKDFLDGKIDAAEYMKDARRRVENLAVQEVSEHVTFRPSWRLRIFPFVLGFIGYAVFALVSYAQSKNTTALAALIAALITGVVAGVVYGHSRRISS